MLLAPTPDAGLNDRTDRPHPEGQYLALLRALLDDGVVRGDRTGTGTRALFGYQMRFDQSLGFPLLTTKRVFFRAAIHELLWFLSGDTNIRPLLANDVHIWSEWPLARYNAETGETLAKADFERRVLEDDEFAHTWGDLGPVYGKQWRRWQDARGNEVDQIAQLVEDIQLRPESRRLLFTGWNVGELADMALPPCHMTYQYFVADGRLSCQLYQRSADTLLGLPWNIAEASLLLHMLAQQCHLVPGELVWTGGDVHLYLNHEKQARKQLRRQPRRLPTLSIRRRPDSIFDYRYDDFVVDGYDPHPHIPAPVSV